MSPPAEDEALLALLDRYVQELQDGKAADRRQLLADHPELAATLDWLDVLNRMAPVAPADGEAPRPSDAVALTLGPNGEAPESATDRPALPADFGKYQLLSEIGRGGMGVVYKAHQKELDRVVAIKMILTSQFASEHDVRRFHTEARAAAGLHHSHIVRVHEAGQVHGQHYFAMEYVAGPSLAQVLRKGPLAPEAAARLITVVARAIDHLHEQGMVHRDLKPSNILLDENGQPYVTDFGLVKMLGDSRMTSTGAIVGTPSYMAPEQAAGRPADVGPHSDVYSLGAILYEMLTGRPPFAEDTPLDTLVQVLEGEPEWPRRLNPRVPRELELICMKCLDKAPEQRYPSAAALADDLDRFLACEAVQARAHHPWQYLQRWARREPALVSRLVGLGLCAITIHANFLLFHTASPAAHLWTLAVLAVWLAGSGVCQWLLRRGRWPLAVKIAWTALDIVALTAAIWLDATVFGPLVVGYPVLIAASGLWFRTRLVWAATLMAELAYAGLVLDAFLRHGKVDGQHRPLLFAIGLAVLGFLVAYQVQRVRALSRHYANRPLP